MSKARIILRPHRFLCLCFLILWAGTSPGFAANNKIIKGVSLQFAWGGGYIHGGDFNTIIKDMGDFARINDLPAEFKNIHWGIEFSGDVILHFSDKFGIGFGIGHSYPKSEIWGLFSPTGPARIEIRPPFRDLSFSCSYKITSLRISSYYFVSPTPRMHGYIKGGFDYLIGKGEFSASDVYYPAEGEEKVPPYWLVGRGYFDKNGLGLHAGIGIEYELVPHIGIYLEALGRYAKLSDWEGSGRGSPGPDSFSEPLNGTLWIYQMGNQNGDRIYSDLTFSSSAPQGERYQNPKSFTANLSGVTLNLGFRVRF